MKSKIEDLVTATESATKLLGIIQVTVDYFSRLVDPSADPRTEQYYASRYCLPYFLELSRAARAFREAYSEHIHWELAGLANPQGLQVGAGTFPSAHAVIAGAGRVASGLINLLMISPQVHEALDSPFRWPMGDRSLPRGQVADYVRHWENEDRYPEYLSLLWEMVAAIRFVNVLHLRGVVECEHALARRGRGLAHDEGSFPKSHLSKDGPDDGASPFTGEISWSPSSRPSVVRFVRAADQLWEERTTTEPVSLAGIYNLAGLTGNSQTRAKDAALKLKLVTPQFRVTPRGSWLLANQSQVEEA